MNNGEYVENEDPIVELQHHREELSKKYPTTRELFAYLDTVPSPKEFLAKLENEQSHE